MIKICLIFSLFTFLSLQGEGASSIHIRNLRCEYLADPLGIDVTSPRLSWELTSVQNGQYQTAYQILVASDSMLLQQDKSDLWNSGKIISSQTAQIIYKGIPLTSRVHCYWKVRVWDKEGKASQWSPVASWTMGLLYITDWKAKWIGDIPVTESEPDPVAPLLRRSFHLNKRLTSATLYATALGFYQLMINGRTVGNRVFAPEWTDYHIRVQYQTYDVTRLMNKGENVIGAVLANGWYLGPMYYDKRRYGLDRRLLIQLELKFDDGTYRVISTDSTWKIFTNGPVRRATIYNGEFYDARKEPTGWNNIGFDDSHWQNAYVDNSVNVKLSAQMNEPVKVVKELKPISMNEFSPGVYIFDMGQNMAGWCKLYLKNNPGTLISLKYGEALDSTFKSLYRNFLPLYTANLRSARQTDQFISDDSGNVTYEPQFTYHGFRFVEVTGLEQKPDLSLLTGEVVASSVLPAGTFECSNKALNRLWSNILWTQRSNMYSVPTDCPQRDERAGWLGDAQVFSQTAIFNMDMAAFYTKWMQDVRDEQSKEGMFPGYSPQVDIRIGSYNGPGWSDGAVIVPWRVYQNYADTAILRQQYAAVVRYIESIRKANPDFIWHPKKYWGDWLNGNKLMTERYPKTGGEIPEDVFSTAYWYYSTTLLADMAKVLGKQHDYLHYSRLSKNIRHAFNQHFVNAEGFVKGNTQAGYAIALNFNLLPDALDTTAARRMVKTIHTYKDRLSTGIHTTIMLMKQLARYGYNDLAYKLLESHRLPSWLYEIDQGATTIWERWDGYVKGRGFQTPLMNSFNHVAFGAVGEWMYRNIIGINPDDTHPGYQHFIIRPRPGGNLTWAKGSYHSIHGNIMSGWKLKGDHFILKVQIPVNTTATVYVPSFGYNKQVSGDGIKFIRYEDGSAIYLVQSGTYTFSNS